MNHFDVAVLGGGSAGYAAARTAAAAGLRTIVLEGGEEVGGLCILRGCMPSKALLYAAEVRHLAQKGATWGLKIPKVGFDFPAVMARKKLMIDDFAGYRSQQLASGKFKFLRARARFQNDHTLALAPWSQPSRDPIPKTITAAHFVIATGSLTAPATLPGLAETGFLTSDDILALKQPPRSLIVLGGGPVALELAQFLARFDTRVTIIQRGEHLLSSSDADAARALELALRREGMNLFTGTQLRRVFRRGSNKVVEFEHGGEIKQAVAGEIFFALGRVPNTGGLGLETLGVKMQRGRIDTNAKMQTNRSHIFAAGDCAGPHEIVHLAVEQGEIAAHNIAHPRRPRRISYRLLISVVFTDPQVATVGLTEKEAQGQGIRYQAASYRFDDHGKSLIMEAKDGFVKLLAAPRTGEILGGCCVGPLAGELIHEIAAAMAKRMTVQELAAMPHYHPTLAEIWTYPAAELAE